MEQLKMESSPSPSSSTTPSSSSQASASNSMASASSLAALVKVEGGSSGGSCPSGTGSGGCASEEEGEGMDVAHTESTPEQEQDDGQLGDGQLSSSTTTDDGGEDLPGGSSSGNGAWEAGGRIHPLMDQVIMGHLFKFLPARALATSRLVCQTWRDLSLPTWRSNSTVKIFRLGGSQHYLKDEQRTSLAQFMDFWAANCLIKPYRQFHLEGWRFREEAAGITADLTRFWQMVGSQMTKLRVDVCSPTDLELFMNLIIHSCPNLKTLIFQDLTVGSMFRIRNNAATENRVPNPNPVEHLNLRSLQLICKRRWYSTAPGVGEDYPRLLSHFPNLTSIKVSAEANRQPNEILPLLRAVKEVRTQGPQKLPIRELVTDSPLELCTEQLQDDIGDEVVGQRFRLEEIMRLLLELRIPAQSIRLTDNLNQIETQNIIETSADALTKLVVFRHSSPRCNFPFGLHLGNLRHLTMSEGFCKSLKLLKYTPNLETLRVRDDVNPLQEPGTDPRGRPRGMETDLISNTFKPDLEDVKLLKLSSLTIQFVVKDYDLLWLVRWMPHVKNLFMFLDDRQFAIACENWKELEVLHVLGNGLTDSGVTGMVEVKGNGNENEMIVVHPNVTCLQKLEVFTAGDSTLTSASLHHGFLKLDRRLREMENGIAAKEALLIQQKMWINWDDE